MTRHPCGGRGHERAGPLPSAHPGARSAEGSPVSGYRLAPPAGGLGTFLAGIQQAYPSIYNNIFTGLPYLLTIIVLAGVVGKSVAPAADGKPYNKESAD